MPKWVYWVWLISLVAFGFSITSMYRAYNIKWNIEIISTAIILGFMGIIATFIVVSNYAQLQAVKKEFDNKILDMNKKYNEQIQQNIKNAKNEIYAKNQEVLAHVSASFISISPNVEYSEISVMLLCSIIELNYEGNVANICIVQLLKTLRGCNENDLPIVRDIVLKTLNRELFRNNEYVIEIYNLLKR
jgi:hypothetical protein